MNFPNVPSYVFDHRRKVLKLYKDALRHIAETYVVAGSLECTTDSGKHLLDFRVKLSILEKNKNDSKPVILYLHGHFRTRVRIESVLLRHRFEENRFNKGEEATRKLIEGQNELNRNLICCPLKFAGSYGGLLTEREVASPDYVLDYWHPLEKAQYPVYFARREERKKQFIEMWNKLYKKKA